MDELILLLKQLKEVFEEQMKIYSRFLPILDEEEQAIASGDLKLLNEKILIKEKIVKRATEFEKSRVALMKKICHCIAFHFRSQTLSLDEFLRAMDSYQATIEKYISVEKYHEFLQVYSDLSTTASIFKKSFFSLEPRIYRNKLIIQKMLRNISSSIRLFQSEAAIGINYDASGKIRNGAGSYGTQKSSSLRVSV